MLFLVLDKGFIIDLAAPHEDEIPEQFPVVVPPVVVVGEAGAEHHGRTIKLQAIRLIGGPGVS